MVERETTALLELERLEYEDLPQERFRILGALEWGSGAVQARALRALARATDPGSPICIAELAAQTADPSLRRAALDCLAGFSRAALAPLPVASLFPGAGSSPGDGPPPDDGLRPYDGIAALGPDERAALARALEYFGEDATAPLEKLTSDEAPLVRRQAVVSLARRFPPPAPALWRELLGRERHPGVRWAIYWALARDRDAAADSIDVLVAAVSSPNFFASICALTALRRVETTAGVEEMLVLLRTPGRPWSQRESAWHTLAEYLDRDSLEPRRRRAVEGLLLETVSAESFGEFHPLLRQRVLFALARVQTAEAAVRLRMALERARPAERTAVLRSLAQRSLTTSVAASPLRRQLTERREGDPEGTAARVDALGRQEVIAALRSPSPEVRAAAVRAAPPSAADLVRLALADEAALVQRAALWRLYTGSARPLTAFLPEVRDAPRAHQWSANRLALALAPMAPPGDSVELAASEEITRLSLNHPISAVGVASATLRQRPHDPLPQAPDALPYPLLSPTVDIVRHLRAEVTVAERGVFVLELFGEDAPHHVSSFVSLVESGFLNDRKLASVTAAGGVVVAAGVPSEHPLAVVPVKAEVSSREILRGTLYSTPGHWPVVETFDEQQRVAAILGRGHSLAGSLTLAQFPRPELQGWATVWGRVSDGQDVVETLRPEDRIERVRLLPPLLSWQLSGAH